MATQVSETENTTTRKLITGYVRYNKDENIESTISTLRSFNAKYTHHVGYVFSLLINNDSVIYLLNLNSVSPDLNQNLNTLALVM